jgi:hypothetical protein
MGGYGWMTAVLDVGGVVDCLVGLYKGKAREGILDRHVDVSGNSSFEVYINKKTNQIKSE